MHSANSPKKIVLLLHSAILCRNLCSMIISPGPRLHLQNVTGTTFEHATNTKTLNLPANLCWHGTSSPETDRTREIFRFGLPGVAFGLLTFARDVLERASHGSFMISRTTLFCLLTSSFPGDHAADQARKVFAKAIGEKLAKGVRLSTSLHRVPPPGNRDRVHTR